MTVANETVLSGPYYPNGATVAFPFGFRAIFTSDVEFVRVNNDGSETILSAALYTVAINGGGTGGTVTFGAAPATSALPHYVRMSPSFLQSINFENQGAYLPSVLTEALDQSGQRDLWLRSKLGRAIMAPLGEAGPILPRVAARANRVAIFDAYGNFAGLSSLLGEQGIVTVTPDGLPVVMSISAITGGSTGDEDFDGGFDGIVGNGQIFDGGLDG
ncbi:MAG: hypothetical protein ACRCYS_11570 [Beijerinckiaceae bacterium]